MNAIYLDHNATTPCDPLIVAKMLPYFSAVYGNSATGLHKQGRMAAQAVAEAREHVALLLNAESHEIFFTNGATESNNLALLGLARSPLAQTRNRIVTSAVEHKAVLEPCYKLQEEGFELIILPVDPQGRISVEMAQEVINEQTLFVSIQAANNEVGTIQPVRAIAQLAHERGALVHCDAAQAVGKIGVDALALEVDLLSGSAHKFYGPKGVGFLYVRGGRRAIYLEPLVYGGGQEGGMRSGTVNVPAVVGLGEASRLCRERLPQETKTIAGLRDSFEKTLQLAIPGLIVNSEQVERLPNTSSLIFPMIDADALLLNLPFVMLGTGSACTAGAIEPSHVLQAMGISRQQAFATVRASLGSTTTNNDIVEACKAIVMAWQQLSS